MNIDHNIEKKGYLRAEIINKGFVPADFGIYISSLKEGGTLFL